MTLRTTLIVEHEPHIVEVLHDSLKQSGYRVLVA
jgi:DNA-binding response OmpR family regulator